MQRSPKFTFSIAFALIMAWSANALAAPNKIVLSGSSTIAPLAAEIGKRFEEKNPRVRVYVQSGGSSRGVTDARSGLADIGLASRAPVTAPKWPLEGT